ncbi:TPA: hypothetical protein N0F65_003006 [Lagenidium giganteum]|uniref:Cation/H+ exchanger transmembrane domain-containing protein n=1 Tax=Lagenidium giganteum TaxID=4803 RepID=A0AAV2YPI8_9STRA|nr:TPA: hypothetical protein N0F65_003006 [Lagenidium giganteum]
MRRSRYRAEDQHVTLRLLLLLSATVGALALIRNFVQPLDADTELALEGVQPVQDQAVACLRRRLNGDKHEETPFSSWHGAKDTVVYALAFIIVLIAAHPLGLLFPRMCKLPLITGYLIVGIIAGPFVTNLLTAKLVQLLATSVNAMALSFISFQAGQEIYLPELRPQIKSIMQLLVILYVVTMVLMTTVITLANGPFFYASFVGLCQLAIGLMFGSIAVLGSPATVMAIKIELNSVGPFTNLMLGATMTAEFVVLVSFSLSRIVSSVYCAKLSISAANLFFTLGIVLSNVVVGGIIALLIVAIFSIPGGPSDHQPHPEDGHTDGQSASAVRSGYNSVASTSNAGGRTRLAPISNSDVDGDLEDPDNMPHPHNAYIEHEEPEKAGFVQTVFGSLYFKGFLWLFMGYVFYVSTTTIGEETAHHYGQSWEVKFEPLLVLMVASCLAGHYSCIRHDMHVILDNAAPYIFLPFFVMTGAALKLDQVAGAIPLMSLYVVLRYVSIFLACYGAGRFVLKLPPRQYNNLWLTLTPQAGVALGLANEVKALSTENWAAEFAATIVAAVVVNQIVGPVLCALGLRRAGECMLDGAPEDDGDKPPSQDQAERSRTVSVGGPNDPRSPMVANGNGDPRGLLPFYKVEHAVVVGEDEVAFEIALELSLYGAQVNVPLLDEELAAKWQKINETILARSAKGEMISYRNKLRDRASQNAIQVNDATDVLIFTGDPTRSLEQAKTMKSSLGNSCPRLIAVIPDPAFAKPLKDLGVLTIQPSIAMANIATRMALLELHLAQALSNEISTTSNFSTAAYFLQHDCDRMSQHSLSEMRLGGRRLALGRSVVNHHTVNYERVADALAAADLPLPPPPPRVSMFGTSAARPHADPFAARRRDMSTYEYFVLDDNTMDHMETEEEMVNRPPPTSTGLHRTDSNRSMRRRRSRGYSSSSDRPRLSRHNSAVV